MVKTRVFFSMTVEIDLLDDPAHYDPPVQIAVRMSVSAPHHQVASAVYKCDERFWEEHSEVVVRDTLVACMDKLAEDTARQVQDAYTIESLQVYGPRPPTFSSFRWRARNP